MNADQKTENLRMLASIVGITDEEASGLLNANLQVTWLPDDEPGVWLGEFTVALLARTFSSVGTPDSPELDAGHELLINGAVPLAKGATLLRAVLNGGGFNCCKTIVGATLNSTSDAPSPPRILALLCACFAAAHLANVALKLPGGRVASTGIDIDFSKWPGVSPEVWKHSAELGECHLAGAGAVGNALLYALQFLPVQGHVTVIDPKKVTGGIINRCLWFDDADIGQSKAEVLALKARRAFSSVDFVPFEGTVQEVRGTLKSEFDCILVGVDSRATRRQIQEEMPLEVFDASTTGIEEVVFHHNKQLTGCACLGCIYRETEQERSFALHVAQALGVTPADIAEGYISPAAAGKIIQRYPKLQADGIIGLAFDSLFKSLCATAQLVTAEQKQVLAPFAFVSQLAGTVQAIELFLRRLDPARAKQFNYWRVNPWRGIFADLQQMRLASPDCQVCTDSNYQLIANDLWRVTEQFALDTAS
ncbi:MAG: ThiF family adenylyltransferase [Burkholderiaceae bacterium]|nr:ThiF family adenylyltransferase [Burkholderiaceae bacterium]